MSCPKKWCLRDLQQRTDADAMPREIKLRAHATQWLPTIKHNKCLQVAWDRKWLIHFANLTCHLESPVRPIEKQRYAKNLKAT